LYLPVLIRIPSPKDFIDPEFDLAEFSVFFTFAEHFFLPGFLSFVKDSFFRCSRQLVDCTAQTDWKFKKKRDY
jgi:hypothetical protein